MAGSSFTGPLKIKKSDGSKVTFVDADGNLVAGTEIAFGDGDSLVDDNGNELITMSVASSAVNELTVANAATGNNISLSATGDDTNIGIDITPKGTGGVNIKSTDAGTTGAVQSLYHDSASPANNDVVARWQAEGNNDAAEQTQFAQVDVAVTDVSDGSESAKMTFKLANGGSLSDVLDLNSTLATFKSGGVAFSDIEEITAGTGGAISTNKLTTRIATDAGGDAYTLADGSEGQLKVIVMDADGGGDGVITPANLAGGTTITMGDVGDAVIMQFINSNWYVISNQGAAIA